MNEFQVADAMDFYEAALDAFRFINDLIKYIAESVADDEDDLSVEFICRRLRKFNLIDVDDNGYVLAFEPDEPEHTEMEE